MRTVVELGRSIIHAKGLSLRYWAEAVNNVVYTLNRTGKSSQKSPFELWFGKRPDISTLHVFGSEAFVHVPDEKRKKWDAKSKKGIFVGYQENCKGYRIWVVQDRKIEIARNVVIKEESENVTIVDQAEKAIPETPLELTDEFEDAENGTESGCEFINEDKNTRNKIISESSKTRKVHDSNYCIYLADGPANYQEAINKFSWSNNQVTVMEVTKYAS